MVLGDAPEPPKTASGRRVYTLAQIHDVRRILSRAKGRTYLPTRQPGEHLQVIAVTNFTRMPFFAALKNERVHRTQYPTREHARRDVVRYIEFWYNSRRRHSGLQYRTPQQVHDEYLEQQFAA